MEYNGLIVGQEIRKLRKLNKLTIDALSERIGTSPSHLNQIELGSRPLTMKMIFKLMTEFKVGANQILNMKEEVSELELMLGQLSFKSQKKLEDTFKYMVVKELENEGEVSV